MGADIHMYLEHRTPGSTHWSSFGSRINPGRDYGLFGYIANVRYDVPPVVPLRGLPKDVGYYANSDAHPDWHSHTWLNADELDQAITAVTNDPKRVGMPVAPEYYGVVGAMRAIEARGREVRAVIWFDN